MKDTDFGSKIADEVPTRVPANWSKSQIEDAIVDYKTSIANRTVEQATFAASGEGTATKRKAHARRISEEERFLRKLEKAAKSRS